MIVDNAVADFPDLMRQYGNYVAPNGTCFCPFHDDEGHRSAKLFHDEDGWRLWCWVCARPFRPSEFLKMLHEAGDIGEEIQIVGDETTGSFKPLDFMFLDGFKSGTMTINELCRELHKRRREKRSA